MEFPRFNIAGQASSLLGYLEKNPDDGPVSYNQFHHEVEGLKQKERAAKLTAAAVFTVSALILAGVIGGGSFLLGALLAIGLVSALYAYACDQATSSLRERQIQWDKRLTAPKEPEGFLERLLK